jgi:hypothetical protein
MLLGLLVNNPLQLLLYDWKILFRPNLHMFYKKLITTQVQQYENEYEKEATPKFAQCWEVYSMLLGISLPMCSTSQTLPVVVPWWCGGGIKNTNFASHVQKGTIILQKFPLTRFVLPSSVFIELEK